MQFKRPQLVIGILIVAVVGLVTMILQLENWVNVLANVSEIYLFGIMLPTLSFAFALISRDFTKKDPSGSTNPVTTTVEQKSIENLEPLPEGEIFDAKLLPRQRLFQRGDPVLFWARFKGKMTDGYFATYIKKPDGTFLGSFFDLSTVGDTLSGKGRLNGEVNHETRWSWILPTDCKIGSYRFFIHVGNHFPTSSLWVRIKAFGLHVLGPWRTDLAKGINQCIVGKWETIEVVE